MVGGRREPFLPTPTPGCKLVLKIHRYVFYILEDIFVTDTTFSAVAGDPGDCMTLEAIDPVVFRLPFPHYCSCFLLVWLQRDRFLQS